MRNLRNQKALRGGIYGFNIHRSIPSLTIGAGIRCRCGYGIRIAPRRRRGDVGDTHARAQSRSGTALALATRNMHPCLNRARKIECERDNRPMCHAKLARTYTDKTSGMFPAAAAAETDMPSPGGGLAILREHGCLKPHTTRRIKIRGPWRGFLSALRFAG